MGKTGPVYDMPALSNRNKVSLISRGQSSLSAEDHILSPFSVDES